VLGLSGSFGLRAASPPRPAVQCPLRTSRPDAAVQPSAISRTHTHTHTCSSDRVDNTGNNTRSDTRSDSESIRSSPAPHSGRRASTAVRRHVGHAAAVAAAAAAARTHSAASTGRARRGRHVGHEDATGRERSGQRQWIRRRRRSASAAAPARGQLSAAAARQRRAHRQRRRPGSAVGRGRTRSQRGAQLRSAMHRTVALRARGAARRVPRAQKAVRFPGRQCQEPDGASVLPHSECEGQIRSKRLSVPA